MEKMLRLGVLCGLAVLALMMTASRSVPQKRFPLPGPPTAIEIERGRYLVEEVAKCAECHTPRKANGELDANAWLRGAPIWIKPVAPIANWADHAPALAGLPSLTDKQAEIVLEDGTGPNGEALRAPMHVYHMSHADALAIVAYLKSQPAEAH